MTALAGKVNGFTLDVSSYLFILSHPHVKIAETGKYYSINEANFKKWDPACTKFVTNFKEGSCSLRYIGSMVSDVHRTLLYGGIFMYPADSGVRLRD